MCKNPSSLCPCVVTCTKCLRPSIGVLTLNMISAQRDPTVGLLAIYILFYPRLEPPYLKGVLGIHFERGSAVSHSGMNTALFPGLPHLQFLPVFLHTTSTQKLELGKAWERGYVDEHSHIPACLFSSFAWYEILDVQATTFYTVDPGD